MAVRKAKKAKIAKAGAAPKAKKAKFAKARPRTKKPRVLLTLPFHPDAVRDLLAPNVEITLTPTRKKLEHELQRGADALISMVTDRIDSSLLARANGLKVVGNMGVGLDNVDLGACYSRGIRVVHTPKAVTRATAELALALLLAAARRIPEGDTLCRKRGPWTWSPNLLVGLELTGRHAVIVGPGRIGQETARLFRAIGITTEFIASSDSSATIRQKLSRAQVLSLHLPLTPKTRHWLNAAKLAALPKDAIVVNTARGPIIDEKALLFALKRGRLFAAALDVHEHEPRISPKLKTLPNAVLLPHVGTATHETRHAMAKLVISGVLGVLAGQHPWNEVDLTRYVKRGR